MSDIMTLQELCSYLKLHKRTITKYADQGIIPGMRIGDRLRFNRIEIDRWLSKLLAKQGGKNARVPPSVRGQIGIKGGIR